jgi:fatty-acyl-CoA synthase
VIQQILKRGAAAAQAIRGSGILSAIRPTAAIRFALQSAGTARGPSMVVRFHTFNTPDKLALVDLDTRLTFRQLDERVNRLAHGLHALGVGPGERVALMMRNCHEYLESQWAITRLGAIAVQVGYRLKAAEVAYILGNSKPQAFIYEADYAETAEAARRETGIPAETAMIRIGGSGVRSFEDLLKSGDPSAPPRVPSADAERGGVMIYTSGTTGRPKGASRNFKKTMHPAVVDFIRQVGFRHDDRHLVTCPLYHSAAPAFMALTYLLGGTCVLERHFDPEGVLRTIERERITSAFMVPTMLGRIVALPPEVRRRYDTSSLRWLMSGAAPLPTETARRVEEAFGAVLFNFYGATETGLVTLALPGEHTARPGTIGRLLLGNEVRLLDEEGREVPAGEPGELYVKSSMLVDGYHADQASTSKAMKDGFFSVGDVARVDAEGYVYLCDRKHDMVISGGVNIYPQEIEQKLHEHPAVLEVAVIGIPDPDWGEALKAFVVLRDGQRASGDELRAFCRESLADYKVPKLFEFLDALPRNPTGKVLKRELKTR